MVLLAILNTAMTFGILVGVWRDVVKPNTGIMKVLKEIKKFIGKVVKGE